MNELLLVPIGAAIIPVSWVAWRVVLKIRAWNRRDAELAKFRQELFDFKGDPVDRLWREEHGSLTWEPREENEDG